MKKRGEPGCWQKLVDKEIGIEIYYFKFCTKVQNSWKIKNNSVYIMHKQCEGGKIRRYKWYGENRRGAKTK